MFMKQVSTPTSALPTRPERPFKYVAPVAAPDGTVGYDHPLENYFDPAMAPRLIPSNPPSRLYETIARAHDHRYQLTPDMPLVDHAWSTPRPLILNHRERSRSLANLRGNSSDYMGISPDLPGWRPRRTSYEDRRGAVGVTPSEVNTLVPYIPPIDTSLPPPSKEWLDAMAKRILADAHADLEDARRTTTTATTDPQPSELRTANDDDFTFDYDTDSTIDGPVSAPPPQPPQQAPQTETETSSTTDAGADADVDMHPYYSDTDTDTDSSDDEGYNWGTTGTTPISAPGSKWLIPRKRPSVVIIEEKKLPTVDPPMNKHTTTTIRPPKRGRGGKTGAPHNAKSLKKHANDTPARHESEKDECPSTVQQKKHVRIVSPCTTSSPPATSSALSKQPTKPFYCGLNGCTQVCASIGDLQRHQQSLRHRQPSYSCLACGKSYTRSDALKRHLNGKAACKRLHSKKLASEDLDQVPPGAV